MKKIIFLLGLFFFYTSNHLSAQGNFWGSGYGHTLNIGLGLGYYDYVGNSMPVFHANYELDVAGDFTLAPFVTLYTYRHTYQGNSYRETVMPIGVKGTYYIDRLVRLSSDWDIYGAASVGLGFRRVSWDASYPGDEDDYPKGGPVRLDLHMGAEYHINPELGVFMDLSTGVSSFGLSIKI
jgi:hypothetical protein